MLKPIFGWERRTAGCFFFKAGKFYSYQKEEGGVPGNDISCLYLDPDGVLWVGTSGHGLARFCQGKWNHFSTDTGLASNSIDYIVLKTTRAIYGLAPMRDRMRLQKKSLNDLADGTVGLHFLPDLRRSGWLADARMFGRFTTRGLPYPGWQSGGSPPPKAWCRYTPRISSPTASRRRS